MNKQRKPIVYSGNDIIILNHDKELFHRIDMNASQSDITIMTYCEQSIMYPENHNIITSYKAKNGMQRKACIVCRKKYRQYRHNHR